MQSIAFAGLRFAMSALAICQRLLRSKFGSTRGDPCSQRVYGTNAYWARLLQSAGTKQLQTSRRKLQPLQELRQQFAIFPQRSNVMSLGFWIPVLVITGVVCYGLLFAFVRVCDKV